jgi:hypothetical protein
MVFAAAFMENAQDNQTKKNFNSGMLRISYPFPTATPTKRPHTGPQLEMTKHKITFCFLLFFFVGGGGGRRDSFQFKS